MQRGFRLRNVSLLAVIAVIAVGVIFRVSQLDAKVYWGDEVYSSLRIFGHSTQTLARRVATGEVVSAAQILQFQQHAPDRGIADTVKSLAIEDSHLPPLYFILVRAWAVVFGDSIMSIRGFSVLVSLLTLPCFYWLAMELFGRSRVAWLAVILAVVSPAQLVFAQEARFYSLWLLTTLLSSIFLLRSLRLKQWQSWAIFAMTVAANLYTQFLAVLTLGGFALAVGGAKLWSARRSRLRSALPQIAQKASISGGLAAIDARKMPPQGGSVMAAVGTVAQGPLSPDGLAVQSWRSVRQFAIATSLGFMSFLPWLWIYVNRQRVDNQDETNLGLSLKNLLQNWLVSFSRLFIDFNWTPQTTRVNLAILGVVTLGCLGLTLYALYRMCRETVPLRSLLVLSLIGVIPLVFVKLALQGALPSRYLLPTYAGVQLSLAYLLGSRLAPNVVPAIRWRYGLMVAGIIGIGLWSSATYMTSSTWWHKQYSNCNIPAAQMIRKSARPLVISDGTGGVFFDHGLSNVLSLAHHVPPQTAFQVGLQTQPLQPADGFSDRYVLTPSEALQQSLANQGKLTPLLSAHKPYRESLVCLWRFEARS